MVARIRVVDVATDATHDLRGRVLRVGTTSTDVNMAGDDAADTWHLGVELAGRLIAISTWIVRPHGDHPTVRARQLRGMATDPDPAFRGRGFGSTLLRAGLERAAAEGCAIVWANARTPVLDFYVAHGFVVDGAEFLSADTGLPHQRITLRID